MVEHGIEMEFGQRALMVNHVYPVIGKKPGRLAVGNEVCLPVEESVARPDVSPYLLSFFSKRNRGVRSSVNLESPIIAAGLPSGRSRHGSYYAATRDDQLIVGSIRKATRFRVLDQPGETRFILAHPSERKVAVMTSRQLLWVEPDDL